MNLIEHKNGLEIRAKDFVVFFGSKGSKVETLGHIFPARLFSATKQVHGNDILVTKYSPEEFMQNADGQCTQELRVALCVSTADCAPLFFYSANPKWVAALHVGWKGFRSGIILRCMSMLSGFGCKPSSMLMFLGPHIQMESFEVGNDVRDQILSAVKKPHPGMYQELNSKKSLVNLQECIKQQLVESGANLDNLFIEVIDTRVDEKYHSARRDKNDPGRQTSFITLV